VDDEELRDLMKANGIGRPSTRANIIETLFKRRYIERKKKQIHPTEMGIQLIDTIQNNLLKSAELTGQWEKQLREIEDGKYSPKQFITNMKSMVSDLVVEVRMAKNQARIVSEIKPKPAKVSKRKPSKEIPFSEMTCPKCRKGKLLKGSTAYGCSRWKEDCTFRLPFKFKAKKIPDLQIARLMKYGSTVQLKGFKENGKNLTGKLKFNDQFDLTLEVKGSPAPKPAPTKKGTDSVICPKCKKGKVIKGKTAYGCSLWQSGCDFRFPFDEVRKQAAGKTLTAELVKNILIGK